MSTFLEPREVEKPFGLRWLKAALQLVVRCPVRFGVIVGLLAWLDSSVQTLIFGMAVKQVWVDWTTLLLLPLLYAFVSAVARGADDPTQTWRAFKGFARGRLWSGALGAGALLVAVQAAVLWLIQAQAYPALKYRDEAGRFLVSFETKMYVVCMDLGLCFFPLLVFAPALTASELRLLSRNAQSINGLKEISRLLFIIILPTAALNLMPSYGIGEAVWLVFTGTVSYVAYRDIFERRTGNLPLPETTARLPVTAGVTGQRQRWIRPPYARSWAGDAGLPE
jgi:hypothetical protein